MSIYAASRRFAVRTGLLSAAGFSHSPARPGAERLICTHLGSLVQELDFSWPGKPSDYACIEAFNSRVRQECLNASWFPPMTDARWRINEWRTGCNETGRSWRPDTLTPSADAAELQPSRKVA